MEKYLAGDGSIYVFHADTEGLNFRKAFVDVDFYLSRSLEIVKVDFFIVHPNQALVL